MYIGSILGREGDPGFSLAKRVGHPHPIHTGTLSVSVEYLPPLTHTGSLRQPLPPGRSRLPGPLSDRCTLLRLCGRGALALPYGQATNFVAHAQGRGGGTPQYLLPRQAKGDAVRALVYALWIGFKGALQLLSNRSK